MTNLAPLHYELIAAGSSHDDFVLFGSVVMELHGIREGIGDIDIFITQRLWDRLERRGWQRKVPNPEHPPLLEWCCDGKIVHAWFEWKDWHLPGDVPSMCFESAEIVHGWPCQSLELLLEWKSLVARPKDGPDADAIRAYLGIRA